MAYLLEFGQFNLYQLIIIKIYRKSQKLHRYPCALYRVLYNMYSVIHLNDSYLFGLVSRLYKSHIVIKMDQYFKDRSVPYIIYGLHLFPS